MTDTDELQWGWNGPSLDECREAADRNPTGADARINLAYALLAAGEKDAAIINFREALRLESGTGRCTGRAQLFLGELLAERGEFAEAILALEEAVRLRPNQPSARLTLGDLLHHLGRTSEARQQWQAILDLHTSGAIPELYQVSEARERIASHP